MVLRRIIFVLSVIIALGVIVMISYLLGHDYVYNFDDDDDDFEEEDDRLWEEYDFI